jgi:hypothetical protein
MSIFRVEAIRISPEYEAEREAITFSARAALDLYRAWIGLPGVECVQLTIPILHRRWLAWTVAGSVAPQQYGYNGESVVAHWRVVRGFYSPLYRKRYSFSRNW